MVAQPFHAVKPLFDFSQIRSVVDRAVAKFPAAAVAAREAGALVMAGQVQPLAPSPLFRDDRWAVDGVVCSIRGGRCDCGGQDALQVDGGPLCVHRLAAMFARLLHKAHGARLDALADVLAQAGGGALRLYVRVWFTYDTRVEQRNTVTGYFVEGGTVRDLGKDDQFDFTFDQLAGELFAAGYMLQGKGQNGGGSSAWRNEVWYVVPAQAGAELMAATHAGAAAADPAGFVPRRLQLGRMAQGVG